MEKMNFAKCLCGMTDRDFRVGEDFVFIDPCKKCGGKGVMIPFTAWENMTQKKYKGKAVSTNGEIKPL